MTDSKKCRICTETKPVEKFPKQSRICGVCKEARRIAKNPPKPPKLLPRDGLTNLKDLPIDDWGCRYWLYRVTGYENNELINNKLESWGVL